MGHNETCSWHDGKRESVFASRGIDFADLAAFFEDKNAVVSQDIRKDYGEDRFNMISCQYGIILNITFTPRAGKYHIITARVAKRKEREIYGKTRT